MLFISQYPDRVKLLSAADSKTALFHLTAKNRHARYHCNSSSSCCHSCIENITHPATIRPIWGQRKNFLEGDKEQIGGRGQLLTLLRISWNGSC